MPTVLHAHSDWSSGALSLDDLAGQARARGIEAIFLADNHLQRYEYGLPPLRGLLRHRVEYPSVLSGGPEAYLEAVGRANRRQAEVLLIPGVEIVPHYYWTGTLLGGTLTMHNAQKNILALGLMRPEQYRELPVVGNDRAAGWNLWLLLPAVLIPPGIWLLRTRRRRVIRLQYVQVAEERRLVLPGLACLVASLLLLANNYPFRSAPVSPYDSTAGLAPHQAVIDYIGARAGVAVWSLPEARDHQVVSVAGFQATLQTDPYPDDLLRTDRYTAFGGLYEDTVAVGEPGAVWDQLLLAFLQRRRAAPAWAVGEAAFHFEGQAGKRFGNVQTVLLAERKDPAALLDALRAGRAYALLRTAEEGLTLDRFQLLVSGGPAMEAGARLTGQIGSRPEVQVRVGTAGGRSLPVEARLIRSGTVIHAVRGNTPIDLHWTDDPLPSGTRSYYRLDVRGPAGHRILSNPIFLSTDGGGSG